MGKEEKEQSRDEFICLEGHKSQNAQEIGQMDRREECTQ